MRTWRSSMDDTLFPVPDAPEPKPPKVFETYGAPVKRPEGWALFANHHGPMGYHRVESTGSSALVFARCGLIGRVVVDEQREIVLCPECNAG